VTHWRSGNLALFRGPQAIHNANAEVRGAAEGTGVEVRSAEEDAGVEVRSTTDGAVA